VLGRLVSTVPIRRVPSAESLGHLQPLRGHCCRCQASDDARSCPCNCETRIHFHVQPRCLRLDDSGSRSSRRIYGGSTKDRSAGIQKLARGRAFSRRWHAGSGPNGSLPSSLQRLFRWLARLPRPTTAPIESSF